MATSRELALGLRQQIAPTAQMGQRPFINLGAAEVVPRATLPPPPPVSAPAPGAANLMGSGSAPIGQGLAGQAGSAGAGAARASALATGARKLINGGAGKLVAGAAAAQAIGDSMDEDSTANYAARFGVAEPTGDGSAGDIAKFVGLRAGGFASDLGNRLTMGAAGKLFRDNASDGTVERLPLPAAAVQAPQTVQTGLGGVNPGSAVPSGPGSEKLAGTALNGFPGVRRVDQANGVPLFTNATSNKDDQTFLNTARSGSINGVGGGPEVLATEQRATDIAGQISLMRAGMRDRGDPNAYLKASSAQAGQQPGGLSAETQAQINRITRNANGGRISATGLNAINNLMQTQAQLRGQDMTAQQQRDARVGSDAALRQRAMQDEREMGLKERQFAQGQANSDREFGLRNQELGVKRDDTNFGQRDTAQKSIAARFEKQFTTVDENGKAIVDQARVARFTNGVQTFLGNKTAELETKAAAGKATPEEAQLLAKIKAKGVGALDEEDLTNIETNLKARDRIEETAGIGGGTFIQSNDPNAYGIKGRQQNLFGSDTIVFNNGSTARENDLKYTEPGNALLPNWLKTKTDEYGLKGRK